MARPLLPDGLWAEIALLPPPERAKPKGGRPRTSDRAALTGVLFVLRSGTPWELLPREMGCGSGMTCWRRLRDWQKAGVWDRLQHALLDRLGRQNGIDFSRAFIEGQQMTATTKERRIAIHEAGHAVIGIDEGQTIEWAELIRDDDSEVVRGRTYGPTFPSITRGNATPDEIIECAKLAREMFAGMHAEWRLDPGATPGAKDDIEQLVDLIDTMFDDPIKASTWKREINDEMPKLIEARWAAIQAVADNLLQGRQYRTAIEREMRVHPAIP